MRKFFTISVLIFAVIITHCQPSTNAGPDQQTYQPANTLTLDGSGTTGAPTITYLWEKMSGPTEGAITSATSAVTTVTNLAVGTYIFRLTATNGGGPAIDAMQVIVHQQKSPDCNVSAKQRFTLPVISGNEIWQPDVTATFPSLNGGDTLIIPAGNYTAGIVIKKFTGDSCNYIVIIDSGFVQSSRVHIYDGRFFKLTGAGQQPGNTYGIYITSAGVNAAIAVTDNSSDYIVEYIRGWNNENMVFSKKDVDTANALTYWPNWEFRNVEYRFLESRKTDGEGTYIGHTMSPWPCDPPGGDKWPIRYTGYLKIHDCLFDSTGWDAIQTSNARDSVLIYNNTISNFGLANFGAQLHGIIIGGYCNGRVYNNNIRRGAGQGVAGFGYATIKVHNNFLDSTGILFGNAEPAMYFSDNIVSCLPLPGDSLQMQVFDNCITHVSSYASGAGIRNSNNNGRTKIGSITGNTIGDPLSRALSNLIITNASDVVAGNILSTTCPVPYFPNPVIRRRIIIKVN